MKAELSRRLRRARRSEIIPAWLGIKNSFNKAIAISPDTFSAVSVESGVWEMLANGSRVGGVIASNESVSVGMRLLARKAGCGLEYEQVRLGELDVQSYKIKLTKV